PTAALTRPRGHEEHEAWRRTATPRTSSSTVMPPTGPGPLARAPTAARDLRRPPRRPRGLPQVDPRSRPFRIPPTLMRPRTTRPTTRAPQNVTALACRWIERP